MVPAACPFQLEEILACSSSRVLRTMRFFSASSNRNTCECPDSTDVTWAAQSLSLGCRQRTLCRAFLVATSVFSSGDSFAGYLMGIVASEVNRS